MFLLEIGLLLFLILISFGMFLSNNYLVALLILAFTCLFIFGRNKHKKRKKKKKDDNDEVGESCAYFPGFGDCIPDKCSPDLDCDCSPDCS